MDILPKDHDLAGAQMRHQARIAGRPQFFKNLNRIFMYGLCNGEERMCVLRIAWDGIDFPCIFE